MLGGCKSCSGCAKLLLCAINAAVLDHHVTYRGVIECDTMELAQWGQLGNVTFSIQAYIF